MLFDVEGREAELDLVSRGKSDEPLAVHVILVGLWVLRRHEHTARTGEKAAAAGNALEMK